MPTQVGTHAFLLSNTAKAWMPICVGMTGLGRCQYVNVNGVWYYTSIRHMTGSIQDPGSDHRRLVSMRWKTQHNRKLKNEPLRYNLIVRTHHIRAKNACCP